MSRRAAGRSALRTIQAAQRAWADAIGAELGEADLRQASIVLDRVLRALRKPQKDLDLALADGPPPADAG